MWGIALLFACLECGGHARRTQTAWIAEEQKGIDSNEDGASESLASFLLMSNPSAGLGHHKLVVDRQNHGHLAQVGLAFSRKIARSADVKLDAGSTKAGSAVFVTVEIQPDRVKDFIVAMEEDVTKSRMKDLDPGCLRFDLLQDRDNPNKFVFYEVYTDDDAAAFHKTTSHYNAWADFKKSGGVVSQEVIKAAMDTVPGGWAFQSTSTTGTGPTASAVLVDVVIKEDRIDDFLKAMEDDVVKSRQETECFRFDLLRDRDQPNRFFFYEAYKDDESVAFHKTTAHYKSWADFVDSGGVESKAPTVKLATDGIEGSWAFQG